MKQQLSTESIQDVRAETRRRLLDAGLRGKLRPGARIAITAGSRGAGAIVEILQGVVEAVMQAGGKPFLVPAMGSHGGATPDGQTEILRRLGITEQAIGAPIHSSMDTVPLGAAETGAVAHIDRIASEADGIIVVGRVKTHPESAGPIAAGLLKMTTVGLGKQHGAREAHSHGLWESVRSVPQLHLEKAPVLFGVAVVENAYRRPVVIEVAPGAYSAFLDTDTRLLKIAKSHLAAIPFTNLDVLVIDESGKNISGTGMDPNVIGHWRSSSQGPHVPDFKRIAVLSLTHASLGNGIGIGMADFITRRFLQEFDPAVTWVNVLTATEPGSWNTREGALPLSLDSDRDAIEVALYSALASSHPRICRIRSTDSLDEMWVSESLIEEVKHNPRLTIEGDLGPLPFDQAGNLLPGGN